MVYYDVTVDIKKDTVDRGEVYHSSLFEYTYYDDNGNLITLKKRVDPKINGEENPLTGYKFYLHKIPDDFLWKEYIVGRIDYEKTKQDVEDIKSKRATNVTAVYWKNDEQNLYPLLLGLRSGGNRSFYTRDNPYYTNDKWPSEASLNDSSKAGDYKKVLDKFNKSHGNLVILNLSAKGGTTYCGHPSLDCFKEPKSNSEEHACAGNTAKFPTILVKEKKDRPFLGYTKFKHCFPKGQSMRLLSTYSGNSYIFFKDLAVSTESRTISVYCDSRDDGMKKPLLLEVPVQSDKYLNYRYYVLGSGGEWEIAKSIEYYNRTSGLDVQNCINNGIAVIDLFQTNGYCCSGSHGFKRINIKRSTVFSSGHESYEHTLQSTGGRETPKSSLNKYRFRDGSKNYKWPEGSIDNIEKVYVYRCGSKPILLKVEFSGGNKWFKRIPYTTEGKCWKEDNSINIASCSNYNDDNSTETCNTLSNICKSLGKQCKHAPNMQLSANSRDYISGMYSDFGELYDYPSDSDLNDDFTLGSRYSSLLDWYDYKLDFPSDESFKNFRAMVEQHEDMLQYLEENEEDDEPAGLSEGAKAGIGVGSTVGGGGAIGFGVWKLWPILTTLF